MELQPGTKLGPYEIVSAIGSGGMGDVWIARDPRLNRDVAIKVSRIGFSGRFQKEAHAVAALNHPNICTLFDVGPDYLVMEHIGGETLADRIARGAIPLEEALEIAKQIADALEAAHDKAIVHRDLKPANVKIRPDGSVKVLDFGLAKAGETPKVSEDAPTMLSPGTEVGTILGTAGYMSPEQARGQEVDRRADIWAFGIVLYEMVTGNRPFLGPTTSDSIAAILREEPNLMPVPEKVRRLLARCLEKDPKKRLRAIGDWQELLQDSVQNAPGPAAPLHSRPATTTWLAAAFAFIAIALAFVHFRETPLVMQSVRSTIAIPEGGTIRNFALSPDGRMLVMATVVKGKPQLWLRPMDALQARPMASTDDAAYPFWSPDSRYIGFFAEGKLKKVAVAGGPAQALCDAPQGSGGTWGADDVILFSSTLSSTSFQRVSGQGGVPIATPGGGKNLRFPVWLPDGRHFLYTSRQAGEGQTGIFVRSLDGSENRQLLPDRSGTVFLPKQGKDSHGHILFVRDNTLMALPFDPATRKAAGDVIPVAEGVSLSISSSYLLATVSENDVLLYLTGGETGTVNQISWFDRSGKSLGLVGAPGAVLDPALSPDGQSVAYARGSPTGFDVWVWDLRRGTEVRLNSNAKSNGAPVWSPRGDRIAFQSTRTGLPLLYRRSSNGSGQEELLETERIPSVPTQWSRDGRFLVYQANDPKNQWDLWVMPMENDEARRKPVAFLRTEFNELFGQLSPDSRWMTFTSDRSGRNEVYIRPFPAGEDEWPVSTAGGQMPRWRSDGREVFFAGADGKMMAAPVKAALLPKPSVEVGVPVALFDSNIVSDLVFQYDVTADGNRFLVNTKGPGGESGSLTLVTNWIGGRRK